MGLSLGMRIDSHGRLVAPPQQSGGAPPDYPLDDENAQDQIGE